MTSIPVLRVARPSDDLNALLRFYQDGLGLTLLFRFEGHDGFDGVMLGGEGAPYHFEFTRAFEPRTPHALNRCLPLLRVGKIEDQDPYWDCEGVTFEDPDGYRIVLQQGS
jgi:catechol 2,3-dioxygenase-like lactoylglutathione lyase family enzyme